MHSQSLARSWHLELHRGPSESVGTDLPALFRAVVPAQPWSRWALQTDPQTDLFAPRIKTQKRHPWRVFRHGCPIKRSGSIGFALCRDAHHYLYQHRNRNDSHRDANTDVEGRFEARLKAVVLSHDQCAHGIIERSSGNDSDRNGQKKDR